MLQSCRAHGLPNAATAHDGRWRASVEALRVGWGRRLLVLDDRRPPARLGAGSTAAADAAPGRPEHHRDEGADDADDEEDVANRVNIEAGRRDVDRECEHGAECNQDEADS